MLIGIKNMSYDYLIYLFLLNIILYFLFKKKLIRTVLKFKLVDKPGKNKVHKNTTPITGGILICVSLIIYSLFDIFYPFKETLIIDKKIVLFFFSSFIIFIIGIVDDILVLTPKNKILIIAIINIAIFQNVEFFHTKQLIFENFLIQKNISVYSISLFLTVFGFLAYHYSLVIIDGINGLFCSYVLCLFFVLLFYFNLEFSLKNLLIYLILILSFILFLNLRGDLFLGNSGSLMIATLVPYILIYIYNTRENSFSIFGFISLIAIPILDMIRLFFLRIINRKSPFTKDLNHFHHILIRKFSLVVSLIIYCILSFSPFILISTFRLDPLIIVILQIFTFFLLSNILKKV